MKRILLAAFLVLLASPDLAQADPCEPENNLFAPPPGSNDMIDMQRKIRERNCWEQRKREKADMQRQLDQLRLQQGIAPAASPLPAPRPAVALTPSPRKSAANCYPSTAEQKALTKLYHYVLANDAEHLKAQAQGRSYYGSNYWDAWHDGTDPARRAFDRLTRCGYTFPTLGG